MESRQVQYFLAIVDNGSFSAAADELYISQSSLSKKIIALEKELGVTLFDRSKRKIKLTKAGKKFLEHARALDSAYRDMVIEIDDYKAKEDYFSVAAIPVISEYGITNLIALFQEQYPNIHLSLEELNGMSILPALSERRFDLAFTRHNYLDYDQFTGIEVCKDKFLVVVSQKNPHASKTTISLKELSNDNFIVFDKVTLLHELIMEECNKAGFDPTIFYSSHRKVSVFGLVGANIGIALTPEKIYDYHKQPDVVAIPLEETIESNIVLVYPKTKKLPRSAKIFMDFIHSSVENT